MFGLTWDMLYTQMSRMQLDRSSCSIAFNNLFNRQISNQIRQKGGDLQISIHYFFP